MTYTQDSVEKVANRSPEVRSPMIGAMSIILTIRIYPLVISLPAGEGLIFQNKIELLLIEIEREILSTFSSEGYQKSNGLILEEYRAKVEDLWEKTEDFALALNYIIERTPNGINTIPLVQGRPMERQEYEQLSDEHKELLKGEKNR